MLSAFIKRLKVSRVLHILTMEATTTKNLNLNELTENNSHLSHPESNPLISHDMLPSNSKVHSPSSDIHVENSHEQCSNNGLISDDNSALFSSETNFDNPLLQNEKDEENDMEDQESTISNLSGLSEMSSLSEPNTWPLSWIHRQMISGVNPRSLLKDFLPNTECIPSSLPDHIIWRFLINILNEFHTPERSKLSHINTLDDAVHLLRTCKKIIVLTGAGVSVSCGIPDFRSKNGIYARLSIDYPDLPDPQSMFDIGYFRKDPRPFFKFAKEIYPGQFKPSPSHHFIKLLEKQNKLLRNYTQNIDTLEHAAGIKNVITCHGSFATATCTMCHYKVSSSVIKEDIFNQSIPYCPKCVSDKEERGIMKPDIVFFGEGLSNEFYDTLSNDKDICDLLIVIGSSLKVRPVATIPSSIPANVPQILINREPLKLTFDIELLGDCDVIIGELCRRLHSEWDISDNIPYVELKEITTLPSNKRSIPANMPHSFSSSNHNEENNNATASLQTETNIIHSNEWRSDLLPSDESNSCDYRSLSAIKLDDSDEGSNQESANNSDVKENGPVTESVQEYSKDIYPSKSIYPRPKESISKRLPDNTFLFISPNRYIFQGAEVYKDGESDTDSPTSYSSECESSHHISSDDDEDDDDDDNNISVININNIDPQAHLSNSSTDSSKQLNGDSVPLEHKEENPNT